MSKLEKLKEKAKALEAKDTKGAIDAWQDVLRAQDEEGDPNPDLAIYNRIGDLFLKVKDPAQAADFYDRAVDKYAELGFHSNAIALCNKVLRNAPGRQTTYLKLAKLYAAKGFIAEAKQNFVEYAERMQRAGKIQQAFSALKEFTDISHENEHLRGMLEEHLRMYGEPDRRSSTTTPRPSAAVPPDTEHKGPHSRKTSSLVFLDLDAPATPKGKAGAAPPQPAAQPEPAAPSLLQEVTPEPDPSLEIETTSLTDEAPGESGGSLLEGLETTGSDFNEMRRGVSGMPSLRDEVTADDVEPMAELEPTVSEEAEEAEEEYEEPEPPPPPPPPRKSAPRAAPLPPRAPQPGPRMTPPASPAPVPPKVKPVVPRRPSAPHTAPVAKTPPPPAPPPPPTPAPPKRKTVVEIPPLELEPDFETAITAGEHDLDDQPLTLDETAPRHGDWVQTDDDSSIVEGGRKSSYMDLGVDGVVNQGDLSGSLVFSNIEETPAAPSIGDLEGRVADNPDDPVAHQALAEALIEAGERERGIEELDLAVSGFETADDLQQAQDIVDEILRLEPNSVRHRQKQVEFAYKSGEKAQLIDAYLELADTLLRTDLPEKARSVYERVAEHDRGNARARSALAMLAPPPEAPKDKKVKAKDAKMTVRDEAGADGDFVDLAAMMLDSEEEEHHRDTRMKVEEEEPTGDEEKDFHEMLARFRQGIDENIDAEDFQSHYDLGVAFKEMGLLDEAIAEFQKALRAPEGKLRTSEALGVCFFEKGAFGVAESILRRGLDLPAGGDQERLGVLYWLGRALQEVGKPADARELYGRVFAVDIRFRDVGERVKALAKAK